MKLRDCLFAFVLLLGCDDEIQLIHNPLVDRWCGQRPCEWEVEGKIERVGTWHDKDYAIGFDSNHAQISQSNDVAYADPNADPDGGTGEFAEGIEATCFSFTSIAKVSHGTRLYLELDFQDDGSVEYHKRFPESDWERRSFDVATPSWYHGVRFIIRKDGPGDAALARLTATASDYCSGSPIELGHRPARAYCENDSECANHICEEQRCAECTQDVDCGPGAVCGFASGDTLQSCIAPHSSPFGDRCLEDAQCESGICCNGACSMCCDAPCADGRECGFSTSWPHASGTNPATLQWPELCAPGKHSAATDEPCTGNDDCKSGICDGADFSCEDECAFGCLACTPIGTCR